jgi:hypothetical protein
MDCIAQTEPIRGYLASARFITTVIHKVNLHVIFRILRRDDLIDVPLGDVEDFSRYAIITNELPHTLHVVLLGRRKACSRTRSRQKDKHPLMTWLDHPDNADPGERGMLDVWLNDPVEIAHSMLHQVR